MKTEDEEKSQFDKYAELAKNSLVRTQFSCGGNSTGIDEPAYIPIVPVEMTVKYNIANDDDKNAILEILKANNLPVMDLNNGERTFITGKFDGKVIGCVALEKYDEAGLLRSLAVEKELRGKGIGQKLVSEIENHSKGLNNLYLLTTTAAEFFGKIGWEIIERSAVPKSLSLSSEFASICPSTATCMKKSIA